MIWLQYNILFPNLYDFAVEDLDWYFDDEPEPEFRKRKNRRVSLEKPTFTKFTF